MATYGFDENKNLVNVPRVEDVPPVKSFTIDVDDNGSMRLTLPNKIDISVYRANTTVNANSSKNITMFNKLKAYYKDPLKLKMFVNVNPISPEARQVSATCGLAYDSKDDALININIFNNYSVSTEVNIDVLVIGEKL